MTNHGASQAPPPAVSVTGLRKSFGGTTVLDGIDMTMPTGSIHHEGADVMSLSRTLQAAGKGVDVRGGRRPARLGPFTDPAAVLCGLEGGTPKWLRTNAPRQGTMDPGPLRRAHAHVIVLAHAP